MASTITSTANSSTARPMAVNRIGGDLFEVQRHGDEDQTGQGGRTTTHHHEVVMPVSELSHAFLVVEPSSRSCDTRTGRFERPVGSTCFEFESAALLTLHYLVSLIRRLPSRPVNRSSG